MRLHDYKAQYKAAFFDFDGVICDTEPGYIDFWGHIFDEYVEGGRSQIYRIMGQTLTQTMDMMFSGRTPQERQGIIDELYAFEARMPLPYVPGVMEYVGKLRGAGVKTAMVTSSNHPKMAHVYRQHPEIIPAFDAILTAEDFSASKPSPDCYLKAAERFGLDPADCIVFEDSVKGLQSGRAAQMFVVGLTTSNPASEIADISDIQVPDFTSLEV